MAKQLIHSFAIKAVAVNKVKRESKSFTKVGKKCQAVVIKDDDILKARLTTSPVADSEETLNEFLVLPLTPNSFNLKGKTKVFFKEKDKYGHYVCVIRNELTAKLHPGVSTRFDTLHEGLLISGHVVKKDGKQYFDYEDLVAFTELGAHIDGTLRIIDE